MMLAQLKKILFTFLACLSLSLVASAQTQKTIKFDTRDEGEEKGIKSWGLDGTWLNFYNARASKKHAGDLINFIRIGFYLHEETRSNGRLSDGQIEMLDEALRYVHVVDEKMPIKLSPNNMRGIIDWYKDSDGSADLNRWFNVMEKTKEYVESKGHEVVSIEVFNEPDWKKWNMGKKEDLNKLFRRLKDWDVLRVGPSTLSTTPVVPWYNSIESNIEVGATHTLGGTMQDYIDFIRLVKKSGKQFMNPEVHALVEVIVGAEEGMDSVCWWDQINIERAEFMRACLGKRIAYEEVVENWSAACVYRDPKGVLHGFASTNERTNGKPTIYNFVCEDADVTYYINGNRERGTFCKKGEPFSIQAKDEGATIEGSKGKASLTHWFTIVPKKASRVSRFDQMEEEVEAPVSESPNVVRWKGPRPKGAVGDPFKGFVNGAPSFGLHVLPGTIEAENYDFLPNAENGLTYYDSSRGNRSGHGKYRDDDVDITELQGGGYAITELVPGEWTSYSVDVSESGSYDIQMRYAAKAEGAVEFAFNRSKIPEVYILPETPGLEMQSYTVARNIRLEKGVQSMHLFVSEGQSSYMVDSFTVQPSEPVEVSEPVVVEKPIVEDGSDSEIEKVIEQKVEALPETDSNEEEKDSKLIYLLIGGVFALFFVVVLIKGRRK